MTVESVKNWAEEAWRKAEKKIRKTADEIGASFPDIAYAGKYELTDNIFHWINGFWPGILWLVYEKSGEEEFQKIARRCEERLDGAFAASEKLAHDVGFVWSLASVADYRLTGDETARRRGLRAATVLMARFNPTGSFLRSWNDLPGKDTRGWTIADNMMNLPLLYWASGTTGDLRFEDVARRHTDTVIQHLLREDGSANHIIKLDIETGALADDREECLDYTQGCGLESSWTRGQAWVLYGLVLGFRYTQNMAYLQAAKRSAHYFLAALGDRGVPPIDFRGEPEKMGQDSSAGAVAACGLIELSKNVPECEKHLYFDGAIKILKALEAECADYSEETQNLLKHAATHYNADKTRDVGLIYADYFYMEALYRLTRDKVIFW